MYVCMYLFKRQQVEHPVTSEVITGFAAGCFPGVHCMSICVSGCLTVMSCRISRQQRQRSRFVNPADYTAYLAQPLSPQKIHECLESLRIALTNNPLTWVREFGEAGLKQLIAMLNECYRG